VSTREHEVAVAARLRLRELVHGDAAFVLELVNDPAWLRHIGDRNVHSLDDARGYVDRVRASYEANGFGLWVVEPREGGEALGLSGLIRREHLEHPDLGFAFLERARGRGFAREAAAVVLEVAHARHGLRHVLAITTPENEPSQRVLAHVGFRFVRRGAFDDTSEELCLYGRDLP